MDDSADPHDRESTKAAFFEAVAGNEECEAVMIKYFVNRHLNR